MTKRQRALDGQLGMRSAGGAVLLITAVALTACGGGDDSDGSSDLGAVSEVQDDAAAQEQAAPGGGLAIPDWWPSEVALPTGLVLDSAAQDPGGTVPLDLGGSVQGAEVGAVAREQIAALEAVGFEQIAMDEGSGTLTASLPTLGDFQFRFTQTDGAVSVIAVLRRAAEAGPAPAADGPVGEVTGDGPGTAIALVAGAQYVSEGDCIDWAFLGSFGEGDAVINVEAGLDANTGTALEYMDRASVTLPDGTSWWADEQVDFQPAATGYSLFGTATELDAEEPTSAPLQITVECRG